MDLLTVNGGNRLFGRIFVQGAKNSVLPILAASILSGEVSVIHNCPALKDVDASASILRHLGCAVEYQDGAMVVNSAPMDRCDVPDDLMREMRSSVIFLGAILARTGCAELSMPGGCELGPRPIDLHLNALRALGAEIEERGGRLHCKARALRGCEINLALPSVGATENMMLAACYAKGTTLINNAAREPEIVDLQNFLKACGARVRGAGTSTVTVEGVERLHGCTHTVMSDRIVAATYLAAAAAAGGDVEVDGVEYRHLSTITGILSEAGCSIRSGKHSIRLISSQPLAAVRPVHTAPYPGFPTDAQAPMMAALCRGSGATVFVENIFENRYRHVGELQRLGADIRVEGRVAVVSGVQRLHGAPVKATDLRGGAALVVAALGAEGSSRISGLEHIDRGYACLEEAIRSLGGDIRRTAEET